MQCYVLYFCKNLRGKHPLHPEEAAQRTSCKQQIQLAYKVGRNVVYT